MIKSAWFLFSGCTYDYQLDVRFVSFLDCLQIFFLKNTQPFPQKLYEAALKLTDLWITRLLFDLNYKFINGSFAFSPG